MSPEDTRTTDFTGSAKSCPQKLPKTQIPGAILECKQKTGMISRHFKSFGISRGKPSIYFIYKYFTRFWYICTAQIIPHWWYLMHISDIATYRRCLKGYMGIQTPWGRLEASSPASYPSARQFPTWQYSCHQCFPQHWPYQHNTSAKHLFGHFA